MANTSPFAGLQKQDVTFDFGQGTEDKTDPKRVPIGKLATATNVFFTKDKQIRRRYGTVQHGTVSETLQRIIPDKTAPMAIAQDRWTAVNDTGGYVQDPADASSLATLPYNVTMNKGSVAVVAQPFLACAMSASYRAVFASDVSAGLFVDIYDAQDQLLYKKVLVDAAGTTGVRTLVVSNTAYVVYGQTTLKIRAVDMAAGTVGASTTLTTIATAGVNNFDLQLYDNSTGFYLAVLESVNRVRVTSRTFASPGTAVWTVDTATAGTNSALCLARPKTGTSVTTIVCYYHQSGDIKYATCNTAGGGAASGVYVAHGFNSLRVITAWYTGTNSVVAASGLFRAVSGDLIKGDNRTRVFTGTVLTAGTLLLGSAHEVRSGFAELLSGSTLLGLVFVGAIDGFVSLVSLVVYNSTYRIETMTRLFQELPFEPYTYNSAPSVVGSDTFMPVWQTALQGLTGYVTTNCGYARVTSATISPAAVFDGKSYFAGSRLCSTELSGFLDPPKIVSYTRDASPLTTTNKQFIIVPRHVSGAQTTYGPPSLPYSIATDTVTLFIEFLAPAWSYDMRNVFFDLYSTENNGDLYYFHSSVTQNTPPAGTALVSMQFIGVSTSNPFIYTTGGAVDNIAPAAPRWVGTACNRLWCPSPENNTDLYFSSEPIAGEEARWNPNFVVRVPAAGGRITAVVEHNQRVVVFKESATYVLTGDGPSLTGTGGDFSVDRLSTIYGCESSAAVQTIPAGVLFKTPYNGWWLLGSDFGYQYIGRGVDAYKATTVVASCVVESLNQARFLLSGTQTAGGILCYDYAYDQWTRYELATNVTDMCVCADGDVYYMYPNATTSRVLRESSTALTDANTSGTTSGYSLRIETGWLNFNGVDGFQRVYFFDVQGSATGTNTPKINITAYHDYLTSTSAIATAYIYPTTVQRIRQAARLFFQKQKAIAVKVVLTSDSSEGTLWDGTTITALVFRVGAKTTAAPAPSDNRATIKPAS